MSYYLPCFSLDHQVQATLYQMTPEFGFGGFGEAVYRRTYSRLLPSGEQEEWADTVVRVIEGVMSIRKHWYLCQRLRWVESEWQNLAAEMALSMFHMRWLPPGRGLWAMGSPFVRERGSMALFNCGATKLQGHTLATDLAWGMDALMCGVGVGFECVWDPVNMTRPSLGGNKEMVIEVEDSREGWVSSQATLVNSYLRGTVPVSFRYGKIRPAGTPLKTMGGTAGGPEPLILLHERTRETCERYLKKEFGPVRLKADLANQVGACVVMGNLRRSAEILIGEVHDEEFLTLKDYSLHPERAAWGWASNNTVRLSSHSDFLALPKIAGRIAKNGEPGFFNLLNAQRYGRYGRQKLDQGTLLNPCGEIILEDKELCNVVEAYPSRCEVEEQVFDAAYYATVYASTVSLLPTHSPATNEVMLRNRRIGVSLSGMAEYVDQVGYADLTRLLRDLYDQVHDTNEQVNAEAGVPPSVRVTTMKPSGTTSQLVGVSSGVNRPHFPYAVRRMICAPGPVLDALMMAGYGAEPCVTDPKQWVVEFPIKAPSGVRTAASVSIWEQAMQLATFQREWADNSVSITLDFSSQEAKDLPQVLAQLAPMVKAVAAFPRETTAYKQAPYEEITEEEYLRRLSYITPIDWSSVKGTDGEDEKYCQGGMCKR